MFKFDGALCKRVGSVKNIDNILQYNEVEWNTYSVVLVRGSREYLRFLTKCIFFINYKHALPDGHWTVVVGAPAKQRTNYNQYDQLNRYLNLENLHITDTYKNNLIKPNGKSIIIMTFDESTLFTNETSLRNTIFNKIMSCSQYLLCGERITYLLVYG